MTNCIYNQDINIFLKNKELEKINSINYLNNQSDILIANILIFINKSKYSDSRQKLKDDILKYMNLNICIYYYHYNEITKYIGPFKLDDNNLEHFNRSIDSLDLSHYNYITNNDILEFISYNYLNNHILKIYD